MLKKIWFSMQFSQQSLTHAEIISFSNLLAPDQIRFAVDVLYGLSSRPKSLQSKYLYDDRGSYLFQQIMTMPEYYLTHAELDILKTYRSKIIAEIFKDHSKLNIIELGAGDGSKTKILLGELLQQEKSFQYIPIDISAKANDDLKNSLKKEFPTLPVAPLTGDYFEMINSLNKFNNDAKLILFLGSNIGNYNQDEANSFFERLKAVMQKNDKLLIGLDLVKDPALIHNAYNDPHGLTRDFNLNLLTRINNELGADFNIDRFKHHETYDPLTGTAKSYLVSTCDQSVHIARLYKTFHFKPWEAIYMEMSQKYDALMIEHIATEHGFLVINDYYDAERHFVTSLWQRQ